MIIMPINSWNQFKQTVITTKKLNLQFTESSLSYDIFAPEVGAFMWNICIAKDGGADVVDFEANFKAKANGSANQPVLVNSLPAMAAKTLPTGQSLYKRVVGKKFELTTGDNTCLYTETFPWVKFMSIEIINGEIGDTVSLYVLDTATGTFSTIPNYPLNQFGFEANVAPGFYVHKSEFDADVYAGLQIKIIYKSLSNKTVGINYVMNEVK